MKNIVATASRALFALAVLAILVFAPSDRSRVEAQVPSGRVTLTTFQMTVAASGTPAQMSAPGSNGTITGTAPTIARQLVLQPLKANVSATIQIMVASGAANTGYELQAGEQLVIPLNGDLSQIFIRVGTNGDGVSCICSSGN